MYRDAKRAAADGRLRAASRQGQVTELENRLCAAVPAVSGHAACGVAAAGRDYPQPGERINGPVAGRGLFTFVLHPEVEATNNFTGAAATGPGVGSQGGADEQDGCGGPSPRCDRKCAGIAACQPGRRSRCPACWRKCNAGWLRGWACLHGSGGPAGCLAGGWCRIRVSDSGIRNAPSWYSCPCCSWWPRAFGLRAGREHSGHNGHVVHLQGVLTAAEQQLVKTLPAEKGL